MPGALRRLRSALVASTLATLWCGSAAAAPEGIPRELASARAADLSEVRYRISFALTPRSGTAAGHEELSFRLGAPREVLLDFRDGAVAALTVNGVDVAPARDHGHLVLPAGALRAGENTVAIDFASAVAPAGKAITRYEDRDDGAEYLYTLFVPMDASMAFPCFDQPDLKARFRLEVTAPADWTVVSNGAEESAAPAGAGARRTVFAETPPLSTYLFAFAAGPFRKLESPGLPGLYVRRSKLERARTEAVEVQRIASRATEYLAGYFAQPFPFPKYDMVLVPELAFGGMEHAGVTFLREESVLFRIAPTHDDLVRRDLLVLHELTHQWFGDLTTMRWFDDLWLKEGFAQYMAYQALDVLEPGENVWKRFHDAIKPAAYAIDVTRGTTPIFQRIPNLADAKSAYGAIVYSKAPGMLKQLAYMLGPERFRDGLRLYLGEHAYANAEWKDLVRAFERVSGRSLERWAEAWIHTRGMPQVDVRWRCESGRVSRFTLAQKDVLGEGTIWPIATELLLAYRGREPERLRVELESAGAEVRDAVGKPCPDWVFANAGDHAYGRFLLDPRSRDRVMRDLGGVRDVFLRTLLWGSLWESVRVAELSPDRYLALAARLAPAERDESLVRSVSRRSAWALHRYVGPARRRALVPALEKAARGGLREAPGQDLRITWFRALQSFAETAPARADLEALLEGTLRVQGVELRPLDRWNLVTALLALGDPESERLYAAERARDRSGDGQKYAWVAAAARPDPETKRRYFEDYLGDPDRHEDWIADSLEAFNYWNQAELTAPYLGPALEALPRVKRERKIFFLLGWLEHFIGGQQSAEAQATVHRFLATATLDADVRLKILQVVDELDRTVRIRKAFPDDAAARR